MRNNKKIALKIVDIRFLIQQSDVLYIPRAHRSIRVRNDTKHLDLCKFLIFNTIFFFPA